MAGAFDYDEAFSRNQGWLTEWEQALLRDKRVAIAGMGGVGGVHLLTLARLGIGRFHIADFDRFELANFNRQVGASTRTLGLEKTSVMAESALDINPTLDLRLFEDGVSAANVDAFLEGVDLYVDGLDAFVLGVRRMIFHRCQELGIPAITAAPVGMGTAYLLFTPGSMTFEEYFRLEGKGPLAQMAAFLSGVVPDSPHRSYLVDESTFDIAARRAPSTPMGCQLAAGVVGTEAVKILLGRGPLRAAPWFHQFDAYCGKWTSKRLRWGGRNPLQAVKRRVIEHMAERAPAPAPADPVDPSLTEIEQILDLARWAPSGDNNQPWRFDVISETRVDVHLEIPVDDVYDMTGRATILSCGFLLETMRVAATRFGRSMSFSIEESEEGNRCVKVSLPPSSEVVEDSLCNFVRLRSVDRHRYRTTPLTTEQKDALEAAAGDLLEIRWFESLRDRARVVSANALATDIRLRIPETHEVHRRIVDFENKDRSPTGVPSNAVGLNPAVMASMRWAFKSARRNEIMTRIAGTAMPSLEMDVVPGIGCAAHFMVAFRVPPIAFDDERELMQAGMALQRFWLEATRLGLVMQPGFAPVAFGRYGAESLPFTRREDMRDKADELASKVRGLWPGRDFDTLLFAGRIGLPTSRARKARSVRRPLSELMLPRSAERRDSQVIELFPSTRVA